MERQQAIPAVYLILEGRGNTILMLRRKNTGYGDGKLSLIAGHVDPHESLTYAMVREAKEEGGIEICQEDLSLVHVMHRKARDGDRIDFYFKASLYSGDIINKEPHKCSELVFKDRTILSECVEDVKQAITHINNGIIFSECGWE